MPMRRPPPARHSPAGAKDALGHALVAVSVLLVLTIMAAGYLAFELYARPRFRQTGLLQTGRTTAQPAAIVTRQPLATLPSQILPEALPGSTQSTPPPSTTPSPPPAQQLLAAGHPTYEPEEQPCEACHTEIRSGG